MKLKAQIWILGKSAEGERRILLLRLNEKRGGFWQPVTGHIEESETIEEGAIREAREETRLPFRALPRSLHHSFPYDGKFGPTLEHVFSIEIQGTPNPDLDPDEHTQFAWLTIDDAKQRVPFEIYREMLEKIRGVDRMEMSESDFSRLNRWRLSTFLALMLGYIGYYLCRANLASALPLLSSAFSYSNSDLGIIGVYSEMMYAIGKIINGPIIDRTGGKKLFLMGFAGAIAMNVLFSFGSTLFIFTLVWCACRFFLSMGWGGILKVVGKWYPKEVYGTAVGFMSITFQFGGVIAALICGQIVAMGGGWRSLFLIPAAMAFGIMLLVAVASRESPQTVIPGTRFGSDENKDEGRLQFESDGDGKVKLRALIFTLLKDRMFIHVLIFSLLTTILRIFFMFWTPKFLVDIGMGASNAILKSAVLPALGCIGTIFIGWWTDKFSHGQNRFRMVTVMLIGLVFTLAWLAVSMGGTVHAHTLIVILLGASGFFLYGPYSMSAGAVSLDIAGTRGAATAAGIVDGIGYAGAAIATWGAGVLTDHSGGSWAPVFWIMTGMAALSVFSSHHLSKIQKRR